jgi:hypothetical protein
VCNHSVGDAALGLQWHVIGIDFPTVTAPDISRHF